ncbi:MULTISPECIES: pyridoxal phosphate-dependent aminotransferase [Amycolatopsis]|uniref:Aminotransferase n=1 Tax=Amycolatopsis bullii TaxID=941987 RepID=A0ABQ3KCT0_9PSEU|nr:pyridoxal phosphate-dependent aminotransferase [Amycolatopsis bullii]GHG14372.1 aminopeptidase [Amycolatopsis bullii]
MSSGVMSPNLALNEEVETRRAAGESIVHLGFGESRLPPAPELVASLKSSAARNAYGPVAGRAGPRSAVAGYFTRRRLPTGAEQVAVAPGSKAVLMALQLVVPGDLIIPIPSWNTYAPQAKLAGKQVIGVPIPAECGGVPDPALLRDALRTARSAGHDPKILVLTLPDNPTGTCASPDVVRSLCAIAEDEDLLVVSDEIYRDLVHDPATTPWCGPAELLPERTVVTTGLSKSLALGGWRIGAVRFPVGEFDSRLRARFLAAASEMWSTLAAPMQQVAEYAFAEPAELRCHLASSARLHGAVARAVHGLLVEAGATCRPPTAGFYVYPDFEPLRERLFSRGVTDSASLQRYLLDEYGIAVLAGHLLGDAPGALRFKAATAMLYGDTPDQQWEALSSAEPLRLPHISDLLDRIGYSFRKLAS